MVTSLIIIFLPFAVIDNKFSSDKSGFRILLNDATSNNFLIGNYIEWIIRTQPIVYPIGQYFNSYMPSISNEVEMESTVKEKTLKKNEKENQFNLKSLKDFLL